VDEHTAVLLDPAARTATVIGNGAMTVRRPGQSIVHPTGSVVSFDDLLTGESVAVAPVVVAPTAAASVPASSSLRDDAVRLTAEFDDALARRDVDGCVEAILALEQSILDWAADTNESDEADFARATLRTLVVRLGELATVGARDPREAVGPLVEGLLTLRTKARADKDFATSDQIRDQLTAAGIEVRDTPTGPTWDITPGPRGVVTAATDCMAEPPVGPRPVRTAHPVHCPRPTHQPPTHR